jgi:pSer/pThr/pTyr-binding forkhead associated (FHA) protein
MFVPQTEVLVFVEGREIARHILGPGVHTFGRSSECSIQIEAAHVSRQHARLTVGADGSLLLEDLGSANGTFLDGQQITAPTPLAPNQSIQIGTATLLILQSLADAGNDDGIPPEISHAIRY